MSFFSASSSIRNSMLKRSKFSSLSTCQTLRYPFSTSIPSYKASTTSAASVKTAESKKKWSSTLLLPKTDFIMWHKDPVKMDEQVKEKSTTELYVHQWENNKGPLFILHDGPPYANGHLHMGHAMNKVLKDFINRYKVLRGHKVWFVPGWDCHGLPIEFKVLQGLGKSHLALTPLQIRQAARESALESIEIQKNEFRNMGIMANWSVDEKGEMENVYRTMDKNYEIRQLRLLQRMVEKGLIQHRLRPTYWSPSSLTALAESELKYNDNHRSLSIYAWWKVETEGMSSKFKKLWEKKGKGREVGLAVWTTTGWTLMANQAVCVGKDIKYCLVERETDGKLMIVAEERVEALNEVLGKMNVLGELTGQDLVGTKYDHLFYNPSTDEHQPEIIPSKHVTTTAGTGLVHTAPGHGQEDYDAFRSAYAASPSPSTESSSPIEERDLRCPVDDNGHVTSDVVAWAKKPEWGQRLVGKDVLGNAVEEVVKLMKEEGGLLKEEWMEHRYPCDWKTKEPVILRASPQWFANVKAIKPKAIEAMDSVNFKPEQSRNRLESFVLGRSEWCISRQRSWGVPIPVLHDTTTGEAFLNSETLDHIIPVLDAKGIDAWWSEDVDIFVPPSLKAEKRSFVKGIDTMDVWFDSGSSWTLIRELGLKSTEEPWADVYLEGSDQHRGWFQSSLLTSLCSEDGDAYGRMPYKDLITHGFILDQEGKKMSKSIGNIISPDTVINGGKDRKKEPRYGADVLRIWSASVEYTKDAHLGPTALAQAAEHLRKLRNVMKFLLSNSIRPDTKLATLEDVDLQLVDRYILHQTASLESLAIQQYDAYHFSRITQEVAAFTASTLSSFYFEVIKDALYSDAVDSKRRETIVAVLSHVMARLLHVMAPITPYLVEEISGHAKGMEEKLSLNALKWNEEDATQWLDEKASKEMNLLNQVRARLMLLLEEARTAKSLRSGSEAMLVLHCQDSQLNSLLKSQRDTLLAIFGVSEVFLNAEIDSVQNQPAWSYNAEVTLADVLSSSVRIQVRPSSHLKCPRCWNYVSVAEDTLCKRCEKVVS